MNQSWRVAITATLHCLTGCAIGEILGMVIGNALDWHGVYTVTLSIALAFLFGYSFTFFPIARSGVPMKAALKLTFVADTLSITTMEIVDNLIMVAIPGAMHAELTSVYFWGSMMVALFVAFLITVPVNRWLILQGKGHAKVHHVHHDHAHHM